MRDVRRAFPFLPDRCLDFSAACNRHTFRDLAFALAKLHFTKETPSVACYDWLIEITERTDDPALVAKAEEAKDFYVTDRATHQRFSFTSW